MKSHGKLSRIDFFNQIGSGNGKTIIDLYPFADFILSAFNSVHL